MSVVRLLLKRTGVRRPAPRRVPLIEIEEVFRVDIIAAFFEGAFPPLRVLFNFIQPQQDADLVADYPLELPEDDFRFRRDPADHLLRAPAQAAWRLIYEGLPADWLLVDRENFLDLVDVWGTIAREHNPDEFWSLPGLLQANRSLALLDFDEERDLCMMLSQWIIDHWPSHSLVALTYYDDIVALSRLRDYLEDPRNHCVPQEFGDNHLLTLN